MDPRRLLDQVTGTHIVVKTHESWISMEAVSVQIPQDVSVPMFIKLIRRVVAIV